MEQQGEIVAPISNSEAYLNLKSGILYLREGEPGVHQQYIIVESGGCKIAIRDFCFIGGNFQANMSDENRVRFVTTDAREYTDVGDVSKSENRHRTEGFLVIDFHEILRQRWQTSVGEIITHHGMLKNRMVITRTCDQKKCVLIRTYIGKAVLFDPNV